METPAIHSSRTGARNKDVYWIDTQDFLDIGELLRRKYPQLRIETKTTYQQDSTCFMILPNGDIVNPVGETHLYMGNALTEDITEVWQRSSYNKSVHAENVKTTYSDK